jgi:hypothetical protein
VCVCVCVCVCTVHYDKSKKKVIIPLLYRFSNVSSFSTERNNLISTKGTELKFEKVAPTWPAFDIIRQQYINFGKNTLTVLTIHG